MSVRQNQEPKGCRRQPGSDLPPVRMLGGKKILFLRNEANKSFEINRGVVRQGETKPIIENIRRYFERVLPQGRVRSEEIRAATVKERTPSLANETGPMKRDIGETGSFGVRLLTRAARIDRPASQ